WSWRSSRSPSWLTRRAAAASSSPWSSAKACVRRPSPTWPAWWSASLHRASQIGLQPHQGPAPPRRVEPALDAEVDVAGKFLDTCVPDSEDQLKSSRLQFAAKIFAFTMAIGWGARTQAQTEVYSNITLEPGQYYRLADGSVLIRPDDWYRYLLNGSDMGGIG